MKLTVVLALCACLGCGRAPDVAEAPERPSDAAASPRAASPCRGANPCPAGCYKGPSVCSGEICSADIHCDEPGYSPRRVAASDCRGRSPCPPGCYVGPSLPYTHDIICAEPDYSPEAEARKGRVPDSTTMVLPPGD